MSTDEKVQLLEEADVALFSEANKRLRLLSSQYTYSQGSASQDYGLGRTAEAALFARNALINMFVTASAYLNDEYAELILRESKTNT